MTLIAKLWFGALLLLAGAAQAEGTYAPVNGIALYYEIHGGGPAVPLVLVHGGGSTIDSNFAQLLPLLAKTRKVIAIEESGHGHTKAGARPFDFVHTADDVAALLDYLHIRQADILGFSNGGTSALQFAIRHPDKARRVIVASGLYRRDGMPDGFFDAMQAATLDAMPAALKAADRKINPDPAHLQALFEQDRQRMIDFQDIPDAAIRAIRSPVLVLNGDRDVVKPEHALLLARTIPEARLAILPATHGAYLGTVEAGPFDRPLVEATLRLITDFLDR